MNYLKNLSITISSFTLLLFCLLFLSACNNGSSSDALTLAPNNANSAEFSINLPSDITVKAGNTVELIPEINEESTAIVTYQWKQISGSAVTLTTDHELYSEFIAPVNDNLTFKVIATDNAGNKYSDTIHIKVLPAEVSNTATINWSAPLYNKNGSELTSLAGYRIYYGQTATQLDMTILVSNPELTSYNIDNLSSGMSYFFCITAFNSAGYESQKSNIVKLIL
jgi:hypothetical protein